MSLVINLQLGQGNKFLYKHSKKAIHIGTYFSFTQYLKMENGSVIL